MACFNNRQLFSQMMSTNAVKSHPNAAFWHLIHIIYSSSKRIPHQNTLGLWMTDCSITVDLKRASDLPFWFFSATTPQNKSEIREEENEFKRQIQKEDWFRNSQGSLMEKSTEAVYQNSSRCAISASTKVREGWEIPVKGTLVQITKWYLKKDIY